MNINTTIDSEVNGDEASFLKLVHETDVPDPPDTDEFTDSAEPNAEIAARASALRAILVNGEDAKSAEWRIKRQWPKLAEEASAIVASAQRTAEKWKPGSERMIDGMQKDITSIDAMNERFVMIEVPGQSTCVAQRSDAYFMPKDDFKSRMETSVIVTGVNSKGAVQVTGAAKAWMGDNRRRIANKIVFTSKEIGPECFNLFTGFGVTPKKGCCKLIHRHIWEVVCARDSTKYKAFIKLLSWQAQNVGVASRIVVDLQSDDQQVGKGVLLEKILRPIYGLHGVFTADSEKILGRFNDLIRGKVYAAFDEACFAGKRDTADKIKSLAATERTPIEGKHLPVIEVPVAVNMFMATNHAHAAHVEWGDMRYWILKVAEHRQGDMTYWTPLRKELENGGKEAFLYDLLARDVSDFEPQRDVPLDNAERRANQRASDPTNPELWLEDCLDNGLWLGSDSWNGKYGKSGQATLVKKAGEGAVEMYINEEDDKEWKTRLLPAFLESSYRAWAATQGRHAQAATKGVFWGHLTDLGFGHSKSNGDRYRTKPTEADLRAKLAEGQ